MVALGHDLEVAALDRIIAAEHERFLARMPRSAEYTETGKQLRWREASPPAGRSPSPTRSGPSEDPDHGSSTSTETSTSTTTADMGRCWPAMPIRPSSRR